MRVGLLEGIFDPPHNGHLILADEARIRFELDGVWFIPMGDPYFKTKTRTITHSYQRMNMVNAAVENIEWAIGNDFEVVRQGPSYTADMLKAFHQQYPNNEFYLIVGADVLRDILLWHDYQFIFDNCTIIAAHRSEERDDDIFKTSALDLIDNYGAKILFLPFHNFLSSTFIRDKIRCGSSFRFYIPPATYDYICKHNLYNVKNI